MACVKQYPAALYYDPTLETYGDFSTSTGVPDGGAASDIKERADTQKLTINPTYSFQSHPVSEQECSTINSNLSAQESECAEARISERTQHYNMCRATGAYVLRTIVARVKDRCAPTGEIVRECRRCYHQRSRAPEKWWRGPTTDAAEAEKGPTVKLKARLYKPDNRVDTIATDPYIKQEARFYCLEYSHDEILTTLVQQCIDGTAAYYDEHPYISPTGSGGISFCIAFYNNAFSRADTERQKVIDHLDNKYDPPFDSYSDDYDTAIAKRITAAEKARARKRKKKK